MLVVAAILAAFVFAYMYACLRRHGSPAACVTVPIRLALQQSAPSVHSRRTDMSDAGSAASSTSRRTLILGNCSARVPSPTSAPTAAEVSIDNTAVEMTSNLRACVFECGGLQHQADLINTGTREWVRWMCSPCNAARKSLEVPASGGRRACICRARFWHMDNRTHESQTSMAAKARSAAYSDVA